MSFLACYLVSAGGMDSGTKRHNLRPLEFWKLQWKVEEDGGVESMTSLVGNVSDFGRREKGSGGCWDCLRVTVSGNWEVT